MSFICSKFKEKMDISNVSSIAESQSIEQPNAGQQSIRNISEHVQYLRSGDKLDEFDNNKLQEQLNMQIQSNQQHLQLSQQQQQILFNPQQQQQVLFNPQQSNQPSPILQQQLSPQQLQDLNQKLQQQLNPSNQLNQSQLQNQVQPNQPHHQSTPTSTEDRKTNNSSTANHNLSSSNEVAKLASPVNSNFDPSALLGWFSKQDFISKVAENAVNGFNSVLITLDPQMKEIRCKWSSTDFDFGFVY